MKRPPRFLRAAVRAATEGKSGQMMAFRRAESGPYSISVVPVPVSEVANAVRCLPARFINQRGNGVTEECLRYIRPLIIGEVPVPYEGGIPVHFSL